MDIGSAPVGLGAAGASVGAAGAAQPASNAAASPSVANVKEGRLVMDPLRISWIDRSSLRSSNEAAEPGTQRTRAQDPSEMNQTRRPVNGGGASVPSDEGHSGRPTTNRLASPFVGEGAKYASERPGVAVTGQLDVKAVVGPGYDR